MNPQIFMVTCDRTPAYVHDALKSMLRDPDVKRVDVVVCGASETGFMSRWHTDPRVVVHEASEAEKAWARGALVERRILMTFLRALELSEPGRTVIFTEDDTVFASNWISKTANFLELTKIWHFKPDTVGKYILAICSLYCLKSSRDCGMHSLAPYHPADFHCTAGFVLDGGMALELARFAREKISRDEWLASDMMIKRFAWDGHCELMASNPSLVDHVGDQSTQGFFDIRRSPSFERKENGEEA